MANLNDLADLLDPLDRVPIVGESLRVIPLKKTYNKLFGKLQRLGITRINHISDLDIFSVPVVSVTRPNVGKYQLTAAQGKGITQQQSVISALMEAVERHAGETYDVDVISPPQSMNHPFIAPSDLGITCKDSVTVDWIKGISLVTSKELYVPASKVVFPYIPTKSAVEISGSSSNGIASGNTLLEATLHGLLEVIERHTIALFLKGAPAKYLDLDTLPGLEKQLVQQVEGSGSHICVLDLSDVFALPTYFTSILSSHPLFPGTMVAGQGCHIYPHMAIRRSITEAIQSHAVTLQGSREDLIRHHSHWKTPESGLFDMWTEAKESSMREGVSTYRAVHHKQFTLIEWIDNVLEQLTAKGFEAIVVNLTRPEINIPVVCVIVPGLLECVH